MRRLYRPRSTTRQRPGAALSLPETTGAVMKASALPILATAAAVLGVLLLGLWNLMRRNSSPSLSQTLMRWRVGLQFVAIAVAMLVVWLAR